MRLFRVLKIGLLTTAICLSIQAQTAPVPTAPVKDEAKGLPPQGVDWAEPDSAPSTATARASL